MTVIDSVYEMVQYSNEVTLNANKVAKLYNIQLNQLQEIAVKISDFTIKIADSLPSETRNELFEISDSIVDLNDENVKNFTVFLDFTKRQSLPLLRQNQNPVRPKPDRVSLLY